MSRNNSCFVVGNLGADPIVRSQQSQGGMVVGFTVAETVRAFDPETKNYRDVHTNWFNVTVFGALAEKVKNNLKRGERVAIQGRMKTTRYTDRSGDGRTGFEILADDVAIWKPLRAEEAGERESFLRETTARPDSPQDGSSRGRRHEGSTRLPDADEELPF